MSKKITIDMGQPTVAVRCTGLMDAAKLEAAWREGYAAGYNNGSNDACAYEWGSGSNKMTARDKDNEWNDSETKASIN